MFVELRDAIVSGRYEPGEKLPTQRTLAAEFGVNMASVREALGRLEQLRLVDVRHGDATRVLDWRTSGGLEALALLGSIDPATTAALFEARRLLLAEAAKLAAARRSEEQAHDLCGLAGAVASAEDESAALRADWEFMAALVEAAGNLVFQLIMNSVRQLYLPNAGSFVEMVRGGELAPLYERAAASIRKRDAEGAARSVAELASAQEERMVGRR